MLFDNQTSTIPTLPNPAPAYIAVVRPSSAPIANFGSPASGLGANRDETMPKQTALKTSLNQKIATKSATATQASSNLMEIADLLPQRVTGTAIKSNNSDLGAASLDAKIARYNEHVPAMELSMRDALIMLDRDIPRAVEVIETKKAAYPNGYLQSGTELASFLCSPALITLLRVAKSSDLTALALPHKLPVLAIPRTAYILSSIVTLLETRGTTHFNAAQDVIEGESRAATRVRISNAIESFLSALAPDDNLQRMMRVV